MLKEILDPVLQHSPSRASSNAPGPRTSRRRAKVQFVAPPDNFEVTRAESTEAAEMHGGTQ